MFRFNLELNKLVILKSEDDERKYFLAFSIALNSSQNHLIAQINSCLKELRFPTYYEVNKIYFIIFKVYLNQIILNF